MPSSGSLAVDAAEQRALLPPTAPPTAENENSCAPPSGAARALTEHSGAIMGYGLMSAAALCQSTRALLFHISEEIMHFPPSTALMMSAMAFISFAGGYVYRRRLLHDGQLPRGLYLQLAVRGLATAAMLYLNNIALSRIPVGTSLTIFSTAPAITSIMAAVFLGDRLSLRDMLILSLNFVGVILVARPDAPGRHPEAVVGALSALGAALCSSIGLILCKKMGTRVHYMVNTLAIGVASALLATLMSDAQSAAQIWLNPRGAAVTMVGACVGFATQAFVNKGVQLTRPGPALVVRTFNVPVSFLMGFLFLGEAVSFIQMVGVTLLLASVTAIGLLQMSRERLTPDESVARQKASANV